MRETITQDNFIHFLGTTGDKEIFFKGIRAMGGLYLNIQDTAIILDPGVGTFANFIKKYAKVKLDGILLSHVHIDHSNDMNIFIEYMGACGERKQGSLLLPKQAIDDNVISSYLMEYPKDVYISRPNQSYYIKNLKITSIEHHHGVESYGFMIDTGKEKIAIITDTRYFSELVDAYEGADILIINVPYNKGMKETSLHLDIVSVEKLVKSIEPKKVILTHFGKDILQDDPISIVMDMSKRHHIEVIAAYDDMILTV